MKTAIERKADPIHEKCAVKITKHGRGPANDYDRRFRYDAQGVFGSVQYQRTRVVDVHAVNLGLHFSSWDHELRSSLLQYWFTTGSSR
ncbi:MAG: hypothetical protein ACK5S6_00190 [bacterium]|jgi:hypothetical protein